MIIQILEIKIIQVFNNVYIFIKKKKKLVLLRQRKCQVTAMWLYNVLSVIIFRYQSTFWMEPRVVPVKYTTEVNFSLESPTKKFTETIDLQVIERIFFYQI